MTLDFIKNHRQKYFVLHITLLLKTLKMKLC